jgi:hypothetical protein
VVLATWVELLQEMGGKTAISVLFIIEGFMPLQV